MNTFYYLCKKALFSIALFPIITLGAIILVRLFYTCTFSYDVSLGLVTVTVLSWLISGKLMKSKYPKSNAAGILFLGILGLLIFLSTLNCTRCAGPEASIKQSLGNLRSQAALHYHNNAFSYELFCNSEAARQLLASVENDQEDVKPDCYGPILVKVFGFRAPRPVVCNDTQNSYAAESYLPSSDKYWCVDSTNFSGMIETSIGDSISCE